ncbi:MAG: YihY/virulence factor BrkB family protein [Caulobacteraceae bacterium]
MSDPQPATKVKPAGRLPLRLLPWLGMAAMAALWPRARRRAAAVGDEPPQLTPAQVDAAEPGRGRAAIYPWTIPAKGWKDILWRTWRETGRARLPALAGGVTYYLLLATFPALAAFVSVYGLFSNVGTVESQLEKLALVFPRDALDLIAKQMIRLATQRHDTLSAAFAISTLVSIWSANAGMKSLFDGINIAYDERERRDYFKRTLITYAATLATVLFIATSALVVVAAPVLFGHLGVGRAGVWWIPFRWVVLWLVAAVVFTMLYRFAPSRSPARWRWIAPGGAVVALFWMAGSMGFSWYINNFTHFGVTYGSLGAMIGFMLWVWFSVTLILLGAELNAETEHQTAQDTTTGEALPMGQRGAAVADTLGVAFTVSPREARHYVRDFLKRQVGYAGNFVRRRKPAPGPQR